jgi:hypothetical protein
MLARFKETKFARRALANMKVWANADSFTYLMAFVTIFSLFADDIRMGVFDKSVDRTFDMITCTCLGLFCLEIFLFSNVVDGYFMSFYFWLDLISTASLITDLQFLMETVTSSQDYSASNAQQASNLARAGRGARIGTKAGRITRVIRLVRLIRIVKLYKSA